MTLKTVARDRNARLFLSVTVVAGFGSSAMSLAAPVWVLSLTGSAGLAALCGLGVYAPSLFGPLIGTVVDRVPRQRLLVGTSVVTAVALLTLFAVRTAGAVWLIFVVMLAYGVSHMLIDAGESAMVQAVVPATELGGLNSLRMSVQEGMKLIAPLAGAALFAWAGGAPVAGVAAAGLLIASTLYASVHFRQTRPATGGSLLGQTRAGLRFLLGHPLVRRVVGLSSVAVAMSGLANAASYVLLIHDLHRPPAFAGVLSAAQGAGSIVGGLLGARLLDRLSDLAVALWGAALFATGVLSNALFAAGLLSPYVPLTPAVAGGRVVIGVGLPWTVVAAFTAIQRHTDQAMIGRVSASASTLIFAPVALAIPAGVALLPVVDHRVILAIAALATALPIAIVGWRSSRDKRDAHTVAAATTRVTSTADSGG